MNINKTANATQSSRRLEGHLCPSLTVEVLEKLKNKNIKTILDFLLCDLPELSSTTAIHLIELEKIHKSICSFNFRASKCGNHLLKEQMLGSFVLSSGYESLDKLLDGGFKSGELIEIYGSSGVGKTLLCLKIGLKAALILNKPVQYFDPLSSISSSAILSLIEKLSENREICASRLQTFRIVTPSSIWDLLLALESLRDLDVGDVTIPQLLIIDSLPNLIYPIMGPNSTGYAFGILNHMEKLLKSLAKQKNIVIIIVNYCVASMMEESSADDRKESKPALGKMWIHVPSTRLLLEKNPSQQVKPSTEKTKVTITKSTRLPMKSCSLEL